jgi:hypothetical protein
VVGLFAWLVVLGMLLQAFDPVCWLRTHELGWELVLNVNDTLAEARSVRD